MRRKSLTFAAIATVAGTMLLGCSSSGSEDAVHEVSVSGTGQVKGAPDVLHANIGVTVTAPAVSAAVDAANAKVRAMTDSMTNNGVAKADVATTDVSIQPDYNHEGGRSNIEGYRAVNTVRVTVRDLTKASKTLDDAVRAGGNDTRMNNVAFAIDDDSKLITDARARAFEDAKKRAEQYASLSGMKLGKILSISENRSGDNRPVPMQERAAAAAPDFALEPGTQTVNFTVNAKWELI